MRMWIGITAVAIILAAAPSYALDPYYAPDPRFADPYYRVVAATDTLEGDVVRIDADSYVIRDATGREMRVYYDRATVRDNVAVGDHVVVYYDRPSAPYAASVRRQAGQTPPVVATPTLPRPQTVEGEVLRIYPDSYVIRDLTGREVRLHVDKSTKLDGNLAPGDKVVARLTDPPAPSSYARTIYPIDGTQTIEGQVVGIEGNTYVIRDNNGINHRILADDATRAGNIVIGNRVVVLKGNATMAHAESINKR
jgi:uncharacterized protein YdeI (BOF family)